MIFSDLSHRYGIESALFGSSKKMNEVFERINQLRQTHTPVLIYGENGTGKELVAHTIHQNSPHRHGEFIVVNCSATPSHLIQSRLLSHEKEGLTHTTKNRRGLLQMANKGTLFLHEIDELHIDLQDKLLYLLKEGCVLPVGRQGAFSSPRIMATTNCNLEMMREKKTFWKEVLDCTTPIFMPPLRERMEDLEGLIQSILKQKKSKMRGIKPEALEKLKPYRWPGNVSELKDLIEGVLMVEDSDFITLKSLPENIQKKTLDHTQVDIPSNYMGPLDFDVFKAETEKGFIIRALKANCGKINKTVEQANIPKNTLLRKIKKYNINVQKIS